MPLSKAEIRDRVGEELTIAIIGQGMQDQHKVRIEQGYAEIHADLSADALATWAVDENVPDELIPHVVALVANNCLGSYRVSAERFVRIRGDANNARREIRRLITPFHTSEVKDFDF